MVKAVSNYIGIPYTLNNTTNNYYIVKSGDTLWSIARNNGLTVDQIKQANNLVSNSLSIGQQLLLPKNEIINEEDNIYIVKSGDTLYKIANKYNLTVDELKNINNLTSNNLSIGQKLNVKKVSFPTETTYVVQKGDTLYGIANKFGISIDKLKTVNNLTSNNLSINQKLIIPNNINNNSTYTVKSGDTLYNISKTYNTTVDKIKSLNNLTTNTLQVGQTLILPN